MLLKKKLEDGPEYDADAAFSRTVGYVTPDELQSLMKSKIAIAGMGGVGGAHLLALTRLGIGRFHIADFDQFEIHNFNRQAGAMMSTIGRPKVGVMAEQARDINPELEVTPFPNGVTADNVDTFLEGVDLYVDGLDFFALEARAMLFEACERKGIPVITVGPLGMSAALLVFMPGKMTFEEYFGWKGKDSDEKALRFLMGLAPKMSHRHYLVWAAAVDLRNRKGPSTPMACNICAGVAATEALKILLKRGEIRCAPHSTVIDAYLNRTIHSWSPGGMRNPFMQIRLWFGRRTMQRLLREGSQKVAA